MDPTDSPRDRPTGAGARTVKVPDDRDGQRLDNFLLGQLKGAPRSLVYKLVRSGQVRVNGGRAKAERKLEAGDEVRIPPVRLGEPSEKGTPAKGRLTKALRMKVLRTRVPTTTDRAKRVNSRLRHDSGPCGRRTSAARRCR